MRKLSLLIILFAIVISINAQSTFTISPSNTLSKTVYENGYLDMTIDMDNISGADLTLEWALVSNDAPAGWNITLCDYQQCFANIPAGRVMEPVPANDKGFIKISIMPGTDLASATVVFDVWDVNDRPGTEQRITYDINAIVGVDEADLGANVNVYPNPAQDYVIMKAGNGALEEGTVSLLDITGATVKKEEVISVETQKISLENLPAGVYIMLYEAKGAVMTEKIFKTN